MKILRKEGKAEAVLEVCENDREDNSEADLLADKRGVKIKVLFRGADGVLE